MTPDKDSLPLIHQLYGGSLLPLLQSLYVLRTLYPFPDRHIHDPQYKEQKHFFCLDLAILISQGIV